MRSMRFRPHSADDARSADLLATWRRQEASEYPEAADRERDERTPEERTRQARDFDSAFTDVWHAMHPSRERIHLALLAFAAVTLSRAATVPATEQAQYAMLYEARRRQLGRALRPSEYEPLTFISREVWGICQALADAGVTPPRPPVGRAVPLALVS